MRAAALPPGPLSAGAGARSLALGCLGPDSPSDSWASPSLAPRGALGEPSAPSAREEEEPVGERDAEEQDTVLPAPPKKDIDEKPEEHRTKETYRVPSGPGPRQQPSTLCARGSKKATRSPQRSTSKLKENKHPFALYGWGEKQMDLGSQKTHNVCASASVHEVCLAPSQSGPELSWGISPKLWCFGPWEVLGSSRGPWKLREGGSGPRKTE